MRWFVEISQMGGKPEEQTALCVEAPQWQPALQKARALQGDESSLGNFSIELLEEGYRAIDPMTRRRYVVRRAPDDAKLSNGASTAPTANPAPKAAPVAAKPAPSVPAPAPAPASVPPRPTQTLRDATLGASARPSEPPKAASSVLKKQSVPPPAGKADPKVGALPSFVLMASREEDATDASPLTYREYVYAVAQGTSDEDARRLVFDRFQRLRTDLGTKAGKFVNLAVFDHTFQGRPQRRPLVTLTWKDWKGDEPEVHHPLRDGVSAPPPAASIPPPAAAKLDVTPTVPVETRRVVAVGEAPKPEPAKTVTPQPVVTAKVEPVKVAEPAKADPVRIEAVKPEPAKAEAPKPEPAKVEALKPEPAKSEAPKAEPAKSEAPKAEPARVEAPKPEPAKVEPPKAEPAKVDKVATQAAPQAAPAAKKARKRLTGDDLLTEMFEAFGDLHFVRDSLEGAEFVLRLTLESLPSEVGVVSLFDMNKREFVVVRQTGGSRSALCARQPEKAPLAFAAMRKSHALVVNDAEGLAQATDDRWRAMGVELKSLICAPVELSGRYLGLIEIANATDGRAFDDTDGNALTYIGQQFAELVAQRGVIVDPAAIRGEEEKAAAPRSGPKTRASSASLAAVDPTKKTR